MIPQKENGVNMLDVKKRNRASILQLVYQQGNISRKDISKNLGLTPAAITLLTGELINEKLVIEVGTEITPNKKGRREVLLEINGRHFASIGICITRNKFRLLCIDFNNNVLFEDLIHTTHYNKRAYAILNKVADTISQRLQEHKTEQKYKIVGIGVSINGIVNTAEGISINSFQAWDEKNVPVSTILAEKLKMQVVLSNNICSLTHGESVLTKSSIKGQMLFIKYGPGLGAAHSLKDNSHSVFDYKAVQLGHIIFDPNGSPCICGNQGCLETIISYDSIENTISGLLSEYRTPILWQLSEGNPLNITIQKIIQAYDEHEAVVEQILNRVIFYLCLAIKNSLIFFEPDYVVLYGELFKNQKFRENLEKGLCNFPQMAKVRFSEYNMLLETFGPATTVISLFFENGGVTIKGDDLAE